MEKSVNESNPSVQKYVFDFSAEEAQQLQRQSKFLESATSRWASGLKKLCAAQDWISRWVCACTRCF